MKNMTRVMNLFLVIMFVIISFSGVQKENSKSNQNHIAMDETKSTQLDSLRVNYWKSVEANTYFFKYSNSKLSISSEYFDYNRIVEEKSIVDSFCHFVDELYDGKTKLILSEEPSPESDFPTIEVIKYFEEKKVFEKKTTLYSNIEFNPKFLEFYNFLDSLVREPFRQ